LLQIDSFDEKCARILKELYVPQAVRTPPGDLGIPDCEATSLYKADPKRYKPRNRIYTSQVEVEAALGKLSSLQLQFNSDSEHTYGQQLIDWEQIEPTHAKSSALPKERLERKRQQLENMANAVVSLAQPGDRIVDFCSGTGHLAILLALQHVACYHQVLPPKSDYLARRNSDFSANKGPRLFPEAIIRVEGFVSIRNCSRQAAKCSR